MANSFPGSGTRKIQSWVRNKSFRIHNTAKKFKTKQNKSFSTNVYDFLNFLVSIVCTFNLQLGYGIEDYKFNPDPAIKFGSGSATLAIHQGCGSESAFILRSRREIFQIKTEKGKEIANNCNFIQFLK